MSSAEALLTNPVSPDSRYLEDREDIVECLRHLRDQRADLILSIEGASTSFKCKLLDVTDTDFLIDDISPRSGISAIRDAKKFTISVRGNGTFVYIQDTRVEKWDQERGIPYFHIPLPDRMLFQQRRRSARFRLPLRVSANGARITLFGETEVAGSIIDVSAGGCRAEFALPVPWPVKNDDVFEDCAITIPKLLEIHSEAVIRHLHENKHSQTLVCGIELTKMHVTDRRRLEQFIQTIAKSGGSL